MNCITLDLSPVIKLTDEQYYNLATADRNLRMERTPNGEIIIMPPTGGESGKRNADLIIDLGTWNRQTKRGVVFGSSTEFNLPNGGDRSPEAHLRKPAHQDCRKREFELLSFPSPCQ